jgi:molybdate transport system ATP-binding protein
MTNDTLHVKIASRVPSGFQLDVEFSVPPGITILFGPSGSGKSTTLAAIAGLVRPDTGRITLGKQVWFDSEKQVQCPVHERSVAFVFQSLALFPHMTAALNVEYGINRHLHRAERRQRALDMLERMKVGHLAERRPGTFSGGEKQRVALARALAMSPRVVLLDEPFSALDRELRIQFAADVRRLADETRIPFLHVTHHHREAHALGDRVVRMEAGRVVAAGLVGEHLPSYDDSMPIDTVRGKIA